MKSSCCPSANLRRLALANVGHEPHGRKIADGEDRIDDAGRGIADVLAGTDLALHHRAGQRRIDRRLGADLALLLECRDLGIGLAENGQAGCAPLQARIRRCADRPAPGRGRQSRSGSRAARPALLSYSVRFCFSMISVIVTRDFARLMAASRGEEIVLRLHHVGGFDEEQRLAALDHVARLGHQPGHPPGVGRKDRRRFVLVDRDLAFGDVLGAERHRLDRLHAERRPLRRRRRKARDRLAWLETSVSAPRATLADAPVLRHQNDDDRRHGQRPPRPSDARMPQCRTPHCWPRMKSRSNLKPPPRRGAFCPRV